MGDAPCRQSRLASAMAQYVALLRGIMPSNPNMRQAKLKGVLEALGFARVQPVISSGNVVFESPERGAAALEARMEAAWPERLGFTSTTIVRSRAELERIVAMDPYPGLEHRKDTYLLVTFLKRRAKVPFAPPFGPEGRPWRVVAAGDRVIFSVIDTTTGQTPDLMAWLDRTFGREVSSRTWKTVHRILAAMDRPSKT
jgi:uncharacterized protein (DUF1697 family)